MIESHTYKNYSGITEIIFDIFIHIILTRMLSSSNIPWLWQTFVMLRLSEINHSSMGQIVNYLGQVSTEVKGDKQRLVYYYYW